MHKTSTLIARAFKSWFDGRLNVTDVGDHQNVTLDGDVPLAQLRYVDGCLEVTAVDQKLVIRNAFILDREQKWRYPLVHPDLLSVLQAFFEAIF